MTQGFAVGLHTATAEILILDQLRLSCGSSLVYFGGFATSCQLLSMSFCTHNKASAATSRCLLLISSITLSFTLNFWQTLKEKSNGTHKKI